MYDTHVHSKFSPDGTSDMWEYMRLLDDGVLEGLGFAEHRDFLPFCGAYGFMRYGDYRQAVLEYREKGYRVYGGAEIDYAQEVEEEILKALGVEDYDYTICSVHMVGEITLSDKSSVELLTKMENLQEILEKYYDQLSAGLKVGKFDVMGHIGIYKRYLQDDFFKERKLYDRIRQREAELASECALTDKLVEVNTSGLFAPLKSTLADSFFLREYYNNGGRRISIGSDAHNVSRAAAGFEQAKEVLKDIGFRYVHLPWDKEKAIRLT